MFEDLESGRILFFGVQGVQHVLDLFWYGSAFLVCCLYESLNRFLRNRDSMISFSSHCTILYGTFNYI